MTKKQIAEDFLYKCASGVSREAFKHYAAANFKHHNAYYKGDAHTLMVAMEENAIRNPGKNFEMLRALEDGDLVAVHSRVKVKEQGPEAAVIHIFRFEGDKIAEFWDFGQEVPRDMPNENGMF
ncbi:MAG TPA: nuclear transport factor 2 family protein [Flavobacteriales bacterium]|nr:nuclear transport factor 2 family protein [Flavobacteriales bacterium]